MFFSSFGCLIFILFILLLPFLFLLGFFRIITIGFEKLGLSFGTTILILFLMLLGSGINIPLTKQKLIKVKEPVFFGLFKEEKLKVQGIAINLGGGIIPILLAFYFLTRVPVMPALLATVFMIIVCYYLARSIPGLGIVLPAFIPPIFAVLFALIFSPGFPAPTAFISGVLGTLIGADILNLRKIQSMKPTFFSIGGAGVFDGIFLVGIVSALLAGF